MIDDWLRAWPGADELCDAPLWPLAALVLRLTLGTLFVVHIYWKVAIFDGGIKAWWERFGTSGYPWFVPYYVVSAEILGAICLIPGIQTRWVCLYALPLMLGAAHFWHIRKGFFFTEGGSELPLVWATMLLVLAILGDGAFAFGSIM